MEVIVNKHPCLGAKIWIQLFTNCFSLLVYKLQLTQPNFDLYLNLSYDKSLTHFSILTHDSEIFNILVYFDRIKYFL